MYIVGVLIRNRYEKWLSVGDNIGAPCGTGSLFHMANGGTSRFRQKYDLLPNESLLAV